MPETLISFLSRWILACAALLGSLALSLDAHAQVNPGPPPAQGAPPVNPVCPRLEGQLSTIDHGGSGDPARDEQVRRYQDAAGRQQGELDRVTSQARRMGCDSSGFFSLFNGQSAQCGPVNNQIQQMRANLDQITTNLERLRGGGFGDAERDNQRRSVLMALAQNNCGPQYAAALRGQGNFLDNLFGNNNPGPPAGDFGPQSGTYRTVCVRSCDGAYFPISFATVPARFPDDEKTCKNLCPAAEATLFGVAKCVSLPSGVQSILLLQGAWTDLGRRTENHRRYRHGATTGRYHRHRGERQEDVAGAEQTNDIDRSQEGRRFEGHDGDRHGSST
jgi:hypothetical protein